MRLWEWQDATMTDVPGNPTVNVPASAGWATFSRRADSLAGLNSELRFHLDSDTTVQFGETSTLVPGSWALGSRFVGRHAGGARRRAARTAV